MKGTVWATRNILSSIRPKSRPKKMYCPQVCLGLHCLGRMLICAVCGSWTGQAVRIFDSFSRRIRKSIMEELGAEVERWAKDLIVVRYGQWNEFQWQFWPHFGFGSFLFLFQFLHVT